MLTFDVLVIGSGGAGMRAALEAVRQQGLSVGLMTKMFPTRSATGCAQGGINGSLKNADPNDSIEKHIFDTVKGSDYLGDQDAIEYFIASLPDAIRELDYLGVPFSRDSEGRIAQRNFGGASSPRTCFSADVTGHVILHALYEQCLKHGVTVLAEWYLLQIVTDKGKLCGVVAYDMKGGRIVPVAAKAIVVATGGAGRMYWLRTTNPFTSTGDGIAACLEAGIPVKDPEFVQFHPTGLAGTGILMSEASRGEGGYLLNNQDERFMSRYAPEKMELATRDLVSQAIETEIKEGRGFGEGLQAYVELDLRHLGQEKIMERLPQIRELAITFEQVDPIHQPIPIRPSCHYSMGGIDVIDYRTCATAVEGVFAAGEAACISIHGANRLGGNSLADIVAFGKFAGQGAANCAARRQAVNTEAALQAATAWEARFETVTNRSTGVTVNSVRDRLAEIMWNNVGVFRTAAEMEAALTVVDSLLQEYQTVMVPDKNKLYNTAFVNYIELGSMLTVAKTVVLGALNRKESRGSHCRADFPNRDDANFLKHTLVSKEGQAYNIAYRPVVITNYPPAERKY
ncbi:FAD-binding protein [Sporomusa sphaeroides]|uniref:Succinate dehydrogenase flavoprotein subunit n=1 Tax=Sporomusa sphaeroides DSM 2875 TaxID=1337886 RepID=A0ABM9W6J1_9FIRM|nr:FAD-binding protein [Sporomusa sphaeroides]OLS54531.1 succinate dehydrogenase flavoprotein subunit [Sporomusa sphaeroides DSM 2875]CVK20763.1 Succinate dehydrogenase flavoprotein subunit [Sporomusa sphaeroides DSM 2875]